MKKIFLIFAAVCAFAACDPTHEDISNAGHITVDELRAKSSVTVDKAASGQNGNVITCTTSAPVNAKWDIGGKELLGNYAWKKMKLGEHVITLTGLCPDGTVVTTEYTVNCQEITDPLQKFYIYGEDPAAQPPFSPAAWDAAAPAFAIAWTALAANVCASVSEAVSCAGAGMGSFIRMARISLPISRYF